MTLTRTHIYSNGDPNAPPEIRWGTVAKILVALITTLSATSVCALAKLGWDEHNRSLETAAHSQENRRMILENRESIKAVTGILQDLDKELKLRIRIAEQVHQEFVTRDEFYGRGWSAKRKRVAQQDYYDEEAKKKEGP